MNSIQIFACDHRHNVQWDLPYIRFGGPESDCTLNTNTNKIFDIDVNADETPKLFWLWQNLTQLGNPDVIGYCQYRRFFSAVQSSLPVMNVSKEKFKHEFALTPTQQLYLITHHNVDGILHPHFKVIDENKTPYKYIWEQIYILEKEKNLQLRFQKKAFDLLLTHTPVDLKDAMVKAFEVKENYLCNIFTVKNDVFKKFGATAFLAVKDLLEIMTPEEKAEIHPYWLAYLFERYTSCWFHALEISGKCKFLKIPLLTVDANKHIAWQPKKNNIEKDVVQMTDTTESKSTIFSVQQPQKSIKCFSIDHRDTKGYWPFSWTRIGTGFQTDASLKDTDGESICTERFNTFLGEWTAMWWVWKHIKDLGNPDYIGLTQYRRYFTNAKPNYGPFPIANFEQAKIEQPKLDEICQNAILDPNTLLQIIQNSNSNGILPTRFPDYSYKNGCKSVQDLMFAESNFLQLGMTRHLVDQIFQFLQEAMLEKGFSQTSIQRAFSETNTFHFNMFVLAKDDFETCMSIVDQVITKSVQYIDDNNINNLHNRLFGYVIERLLSCIFFLLINSKKIFTELPIILLPKVEMIQQKQEVIVNHEKTISPLLNKDDLTCPKYSILTFIMGEKYELVHEVQHKQNNVEYILVTDNKNLKSDTWNVVYDENLLKYNSPFERCFRVRYNAFDYVNTDTCVTIDGSMEVCGSLDPIVQKFIEEDYDICLMPHPFRFDFISEYQAWVKQRRYPVEKAKKFFELLQNSKYDPNFKGLIQLCFSIKKRNCQKTRALDHLVFSFLEYLSVGTNFERLDQTVYSFVLNTWFKDLNILPISEQIVRSEAIQWYCHGSMIKNMNFFMTPGKPDKRWLLNSEVECLQLLNGKAIFPR